MSRIVIEYCPLLSEEANVIIESNLTASMVSNDDTTKQYEIEMVRELLVEYDYFVDIEVITKLITEGVNYIEI
jgi:hypothetical protein